MSTCLLTLHHFKWFFVDASVKPPWPEMCVTNKYVECLPMGCVKLCRSDPIGLFQTQVVSPGMTLPNNFSIRQRSGLLLAALLGFITGLNPDTHFGKAASVPFSLACLPPVLGWSL